MSSGSSAPPAGERRGPSSRRREARRSTDLSIADAARRIEAGSVVVTGIVGRLGRRLARQLHRERAVIGVDRREFPDRPKDIEHFPIDIRRKKARDIFRRPDVGALVHLGVFHNPRGNSEEHHSWNVLGFQKLLEYVRDFDVPKLVLVSSANVYGPRPDNPQFLSEDAPLLGAGAFSDIRDLVTLDMLAQSFFWKYPRTETVILRPTHILGTVRNAPSNYLRMQVVPTLMGFDPMIQAVHQDDLVEAIRLALRPGIRGIFNIGGPPPVPLSQALRLLGRAALPMPHAVAKVAIERLWRWRMTSFPAPELDYIRYVCMVDDSRARHVLGYSPRFDLEATLKAVDEERWV
ncbi:MAG: NAD-dependent epimerase/dehydratase family protein [Sorangiineae bacterium]|nr:NAD-dependent epimerase/dehydratase family protein [Polyangiaceae bacterium]MEB2322495.1 NAD-dependent epimerase/dehydratase family protein [Sorangiineae bacterium]